MQLDPAPQAKTGIPWVWSQWLEQVYIWITRSRPALMTEQASTSGTSIDFTNIPAWVKKITVMFVGVSVSGTSNILIQLGDSGGTETTGYAGAGATIVSATIGTGNSSAGFMLRTGSAAFLVHGSIGITLEDAANNTWIASGVFGRSDTNDMLLTAGSKSLSDTLTQLRITTVNGTDTFDAGAINVMYE